MTAVTYAMPNPIIQGSLAVLGAGQMGAGIAQVAASKGIPTRLFDISEAAIKKALHDIARRLDKGIEKGALSSEQKAHILSLLKPATELSDCADSEVVIEAVVENLDVKARLFSGLDALCPPETVFASNTSSISITKLAAATLRPDRCIGMHFMNPVPVMQLVEIIRGLQTSDVTYHKILQLTQFFEKVPVTARHDYPGFIVNRILIPMLNEACFVLMEGIATVEEIDTAMRLGTNQPMGPLTLADFVGLDTCLAICRIFHEELGDDKYRPCPLLVKYVEAGWLGKKTGRGFYSYSN